MEEEKERKKENIEKEERAKEMKCNGYMNTSSD
jgi:hypothetical protein